MGYYVLSQEVTKLYVGRDFPKALYIHFLKPYIWADIGLKIVREVGNSRTKTEIL